jgi:hypothetical protein
MPSLKTPWSCHPTSAWLSRTASLSAWNPIRSRARKRLGTQRLHGVSHALIQEKFNPYQLQRFSTACTGLHRDREQSSGVPARGRVRGRGGRAILRTVRSGLGARFRAELMSVCAVVARQPLLWRERPGGFRRVNLPGFPFYVAYFTRSERILVAAVGHVSRRPNYWKRRQF